jgi:hypothetical protein
MPAGCTDRLDAFAGWRVIGRVRLVTTSGSPHAARSSAPSCSRNSWTSGRATGKETPRDNSKSPLPSIRTSLPRSTLVQTSPGVRRKT